METTEIEKTFQPDLEKVTPVSSTLAPSNSRHTSVVCSRISSRSRAGIRLAFTPVPFDRTRAGFVPRTRAWVASVRGGIQAKTIRA